MILLRLSTVIRDITVEIEGEANSFDDIQEAWESFILSTYQIENEGKPSRIKDLQIHKMNLCEPIQEVL